MNREYRNAIPILCERVFVSGKHCIEEIIADAGDGEKKLVWCLAPFDARIVNGRDNKLFHINFRGWVNGKEIARARRLVREAFLKYHK